MSKRGGAQSTIGRLMGERQNGRKRMVFIHSAGATSRLWEDEVAYFNTWYDTLALDLPGRGGTGGEGETDAFAYGDFAARAMRELDFFPAVIVGLSMGGAVAQALSLSHPDLVTGLVLMGTGAKMPVASAIFAGIEKDYDAFLDMSGSVAYGPDTDREVIERYRKIFAAVEPQVTSGDYTACNTFDSRGRLDEIGVPTLIISGDKDNLMAMKFSTYLNEHVGDSELEIFPGAGHFVMAEEPTEFRRVVRRFMEKL
ncbi:MAG: alpha/beta hydrolase [Deltaproteobacteria bacterium]|nr:alpha/beta hydrolase [Candidatus Zymogenaceae bacterium]